MNLWIRSLTCHIPHVPIGDASTQFKSSRQHFQFRRALRKNCIKARRLQRFKLSLSCECSKWPSSWVHIYIGALPTRPPCYHCVDKHTHISLYKRPCHQGCIVHATRMPHTLTNTLWDCVQRPGLLLAHLSRRKH